MTTTKTRKTAKAKTAQDAKAAAAKAKAKASKAADAAAAEDEDEAEETPAPLDQAHREARRLVVRYRRQLAPLAAMGATQAAGAAAAAADGAAAVGVLAATGAATGVAYAIGRRRLGRWSRAYAAVACTASMSWQAAAAVAGADHLQALLWLGGGVLALPWWIRHSERTPDVTAEQSVQDAAPAPEAPAAPDWRTVRWGKYLAAQGRALPGSKISEIAEIPYGWTATVDLPRGEHWEKVTGCLATIASVFDLGDGRVLAEPVHGAPVYRARLTVLTTSPLEKVTKWTGPGLDAAEGTFPAVVTADGERLPWRLWWPGAGMCHGLIAGTTGSGKSAALDLVLSEIAMSDRLIPVIIDGSGGMSLPDWIPHVPYQATTIEEAIELLERLVAAMDARFDKLRKVRWTDKHGRARVGRNSIDPTPDMPGIAIIIDEAHRLLMDSDHGKRIRRLVEIITQMGRKVAFSVILATQQASVSQLGGSSVIRDMCKGGNVIALRTGERVSGGMVGNVALPEPLHTLPLEWPDGSPTQGLCYVTTARAIRSRTLWVEDPYACATGQTQVRLDALTRAHLDGAETQAEPAAGDEPSTGELAARARVALEDGTPADPAEIARATGMTWRQAKTALAELHANA
ncbi:FtsK/SpoIIIE domain-containing protein [Actinomadura coerulea]|uniref:FtsK/SpoIIIE domain-containing protein n=1 Tax=Actinomadura coerulea TaxID=46159 RepID=UPI00341C8CB3